MGLLQLRGKTHYFMGEIEALLSIVRTQHCTEFKAHIDAMLALILECRCYLALAESEKSHKCMFNIIRLLKAHPECVAMYAESYFYKVYEVATASGAFMPIFECDIRSYLFYSI